MNRFPIKPESHVVFVFLVFRAFEDVFSGSASSRSLRCSVSTSRFLVSFHDEGDEDRDGHGCSGDND